MAVIESWWRMQTQRLRLPPITQSCDDTHANSPYFPPPWQGQYARLESSRGLLAGKICKLVMCSPLLAKAIPCLFGFLRLLKRSLFSPCRLWGVGSRSPVHKVRRRSILLSWAQE